MQWKHHAHPVHQMSRKTEILKLSCGEKIPIKSEDIKIAMTGMIRSKITGKHRAMHSWQKIIILMMYDKYFENQKRNRHYYFSNSALLTI